MDIVETVEATKDVQLTSVGNYKQVKVTVIYHGHDHGHMTSYLYTDYCTENNTRFNGLFNKTEIFIFLPPFPWEQNGCQMMAFLAHLMIAKLWKT